MNRNDIIYIIVAIMAMVLLGGFLISLLPFFLFLVIFAIVAVGGFMVYRTIVELFREATKKQDHYDSEGRRITKVSVIEMSDSNPEDEKKKEEKSGGE